SRGGVGDGAEQGAALLGFPALRGPDGTEADALRLDGLLHAGDGARRLAGQHVTAEVFHQVVHGLSYVSSVGVVHPGVGAGAVSAAMVAAPRGAGKWRTSLKGQPVPQ